MTDDAIVEALRARLAELEVEAAATQARLSEVQDMIARITGKRQRPRRGKATWPASPQHQPDGTEPLVPAFLTGEAEHD